MSVSYCKKSEIESESSKALFASDLSCRLPSSGFPETNSSCRLFWSWSNFSPAGAVFARPRNLMTSQTPTLFAPELSFELPIVVATCEPFPVRWQPPSPAPEPGLTFAPTPHLRSGHFYRLIDSQAGASFTTQFVRTLPLCNFLLEIDINSVQQKQSNLLA